MNRYFNIVEPKDNRGLFVTILSYEMTHIYWEELVSAIKGNLPPSGLCAHGR